MIKVAPSILSADPMNMGRDILRMEAAGCDWLHVDIMDGHFVPNMTYGPALVKAISGITQLPQDVHLMIDNPEKYVDAFAANGAAYITIHAEIPGDVQAVLAQIRAAGARPGISVKPGTDIDAITAYLPLVDMVLVMTVELGFGGQKFMPDMIPKITRLRELGFTGLINVDGGVSLANIEALAAAGIDVAVMGTAMFYSPDPKTDLQKIHAI